MSKEIEIKDFMSLPEDAQLEILKYNLYQVQNLKELSDSELLGWFGDVGVEGNTTEECWKDMLRMTLDVFKEALDGNPRSGLLSAVRYHKSAGEAIQELYEMW